MIPSGDIHFRMWTLHHHALSFKNTAIIPVLKKHFSPQLHPMEHIERLAMLHITLGFLTRPPATSTVLHLPMTYLDKQDNNVRMLFMRETQNMCLNFLTEGLQSHRISLYSGANLLTMQNTASTISYQV